MRGLTRAVGDGALALTGQVAQNLIVRNTPTLPIPGMLGDLAKDVLALVLGAWGASFVLGGEKARFFVAGQVTALGGRLLRSANIPVVSSALSGYDSYSLGTYVNARRTIAPPPARARTLAGVGVYVDGAAASAMP